MRETCMMWGIETGDGWYWLINNLCKAIQDYIDWNKKDQVEASQVKEKFGRLCFYTDGSDDMVEGIISFAEMLSVEICEDCGSLDDVTSEGSWVRTRCKNCRNELSKK